MALVHVHAFSIVVRFIFEASFAVTAVGADAVNALGVRWARASILVKLAFVDVLAISIVRRHEASGTHTSVAARFIFARLLRSADRFPSGALINVDTLTPICIQLKAALTTQRVETTVGSIRVHALLTSRAWISDLAFVNIFRWRKR